MKLRTLIAFAALAPATIALAACGGGSSGSASAKTGTSGPKVSTAKNAKLNKTILVNSSGRTLYALSVEKKGHFICTDKTCTSLWHPLAAKKGQKPTGVGSLSTLTRPDGKLQVAYKGKPLYTFVQDRKRGDVKGEGFKDVGTWHAVSKSGSSSSSSGSSGSGGGYGNGGYGY
jgi:predicted lipoprotein with Yx(FWY)xxD motif